MAHRQKAKKARLEAAQAEKSATPEVTPSVTVAATPASTVSPDATTSSGAMALTDALDAKAAMEEP